jgi:hypothetical protein
MVNMGERMFPEEYDVTERAALYTPNLKLLYFMMYGVFVMNLGISILALIGGRAFQAVINLIVGCVCAYAIQHSIHRTIATVTERKLLHGK